jgi:NAD(P)-dependent dehydrogenase (short-subunit alcohol dehydrogenase family)
LTEAVLAAGDKVAATARTPQQLDGLVAKYGGQIYPIKLDVTDHDEVYQAVADTVKHFGRIDVLVNNAGFGIIGAAEAFTEEQVRSQLETNLYAPIAITRAVLPFMRKQGSGFIMQISSLGGRIGSPGVSIYQAAKFGLAGFSESLVKEVTPLGIRVTCVEPGGFRTDWAGDSMTYAPHVEGYEETVDKRVDYFRSGKFVPMGDPAKAAKVILQLADEPQPPVHLLLGSEAVAMVENATAVRDAELKKWKSVSISTDAENVENFLESDFGKRYKE